MGFSSSKLVLRNLCFHWRIHLCVAMGAAVSTAIWVGALAVGDSVRYSLRQLVVKRLGDVEFTLSGGERFFRVDLARDLSDVAGVAVAPVLQLQGTVAGATNGSHVGKVQFLGVDDRFWAMSPTASVPAELRDEETAVNSSLARRLGLSSGDEILMRIEKPSLLSRDIPLSSDRELSMPLRLKVKAVVSDDQFGRFSLKNDQVAPLQVYLPLRSLCRHIDQEDRANLLLVSGLKNGASLSVQELNDAVRRVWDLEDIGLNVRVLADGKTVELRSRRVFLEQPIVEAAFKAFPDAKGTFTYLVNAIRHDDMTTPYSFVSAPGEPVVAADMADDEIIVNEWLAEDLDLKPSDSVALSYYVMGKGRTLEEKTASFKVRSVVPLGGPATDRELMPSFPGLSDSGYCRDWDTGIPISLGKIRTKDEDYWNQYRGTPKAFVTLPAAQTMWRNRFGALTSIRCSGQTVEDVSNAIRRALTPPAVGLLFRPVKEEGLKAVGQSVDFGQLFVGLSGFILVAALILMALLFAFGVERRMEERGLLLALGFSSRRVVLFLLAEGIVLATAGAVLGVAGGILYNQLVLRELASVWKGAIGVLPLTPHVEPVTLIVGAVSGIMVAVLAMGWVLWKQAGFSISVLQSGHGRCEEKCAIRRSRIVSALAAACFLGALATATLAGHGKDKEPSGIFFGVGALMLVGSLMMCHGLLTRMAAPMTTHRLSLVLVGCRNIARRRGRSLATIGLLACGIFVVFAVGANRQDVLRDADRRESGTGGFALIGETTIPIVHALNDDKVRRQLGLDGAEMAGVRFVQIRVKDGDDASCLNLNRAQNVRILGVNPREFDDRGSFRFSETGKRANPVRPWLLLNSPDSAVADQTVITWGLGKSVGGVHSYENDQGSVREVKFMAGLSGSLFQGSILLSEDRFCEDFPSVSGYRMFLADVPSGKEAAVERTLRRVFENYGLDLVPASRRLAEFSIVENTYLAIFLALGGLGLMLGSLGVGIVVFRNVQDRRRELAVLRAVGFSRRSLQWVIVSEHLVLLMAGLVFGVVSAVVAILPTLMRSAVEAPKTLMIGLVLALFLCGVFWTWLAASFAARGDLLPALREE